MVSKFCNFMENFYAPLDFTCNKTSYSRFRGMRFRASSYEPGNRAGSVTGTNFLCCVHTGNFSPVDRDEFNKRNQNGGT